MRACMNVLLFLIVLAAGAALYFYPEMRKHISEQPIAIPIGMPTAAPIPQIAPFFDESVQHWNPRIQLWAHLYDVSPEIQATVMQVESCGNPTAESSAGARGLFQVMPHELQADEDPYDPEVNAHRGLAAISECLYKSEGDVGLAFACYNGGPGVLSKTVGAWPRETQIYYLWATRIYSDAKAGVSYSRAYDGWLGERGLYMCRNAARVLSSGKYDDGR